MENTNSLKRVSSQIKILKFISNLIFQANMHSGHGFAYDTMRRAEVYSRHHPLGLSMSFYSIFLSRIYPILHGLSTSVLVFGSWLLNHVIYLKQRQK